MSQSDPQRGYLIRRVAGGWQLGRPARNGWIRPVVTTKPPREPEIPPRPVVHFYECMMRRYLDNTWLYQRVFIWAPDAKALRAYQKGWQIDFLQRLTNASSFGRRDNTHTVAFHTYETEEDYWRELQAKLKPKKSSRPKRVLELQQPEQQSNE